MSQKFQLKSPYQPAGDQPAAIDQLVSGVTRGDQAQTLLGVTGSGKTFTMANVIQHTQKPALIISHNKTLTAQLTEEFKQFFPNNAVEYFVSYYDYYQPEAYIPRTDTYIKKDADINQEIDRLRHAAMESVLTRQDVIVVASVSCIYGLGTPKDYLDLRLQLTTGDHLSRQDVIRHLTRLQYTRNDDDLKHGTFRVRGDILDIHPSSSEDILRLEFFGPQIEKLTWLDQLTNHVVRSATTADIFPATFFITDPNHTKSALSQIRADLNLRIKHLKKLNKISEAERLAQRTNYDLEMIEQLGFVSGIENYSRYLDDRQPGEPPSTLIDYFIHSFGLDGFLTFIDESHMTIPQIGAMYAGDQARKQSLVEYGFRLPSAKDNRPLTFAEFEDRTGQTIFVSATPADYEHNTSQQIVEQIARPTGLLDPKIDIRPLDNQIDDVISEAQEEIKHGHRVLITTLTKRLSEDLSTYLVESGLKAAYLHSEVDTLERLDILRDLRAGRYDVLVGINLLREGLDLPEVSLVAILDADKEGYLRSRTALIQIMGRGARHLNGRVIMYADKVTGSMQQAIDESSRRRVHQEKFNQTHNINPTSIKKDIHASLRKSQSEIPVDFNPQDIPATERRRLIKELQAKMDLASRNLEFERAAELRDAIKKLTKTR